MKRTRAIHKPAGALGLALLITLATTACRTDAQMIGSTPAADVMDHSEHGVSGHGTHDHSSSSSSHAEILGLIDPSNATHVAVASGDWTSTDTWGGTVPGTGAFVHVPAGVTVRVDDRLNPEIERVGIDGTLQFATDVDTELKVDTIVTSPTGMLEIGSADEPVAAGVTARITFADDGPIDRSTDATFVSRGAILAGTTVVHGAPKLAFSELASFPLAGDTTLELVRSPEGWRIGDAITIAGTDPNDPTSDEVRTISAIEGQTVTLDRPLERDHVAPANDLDVHVANLVRNVVFTSENESPDRRGHVMFHHTNAVDVNHAWFDQLGRSDKARGYDDLEFVDLDPTQPATVLGGDNVRGRYSVHFHRGGTDRSTPPARVHGSVVTNDPGWAFVNHSSNVDFSDNVAHNIVGAAYYTEAGDEIGSFERNIAVRIVNPAMLLKGDPESDGFDPDAREERQDFGFQGDGMWLHSPNVTVVDNVFSGISGHGFIVWPEGLLERNADGSTTKVFHDTANVPGGELIGPAGTPMQIMDVPVPVFDRNQIYSATRGIQLYYLHTEFFGQGLHAEDCTIDPSVEYDAQLRSTFSNSVVWNVDQTAFAAPYANRIGIDGLRLVGDGSSDTVGIDLGHFRNEIGLTVSNVTVEGFGIGARLSAVADIQFTGDVAQNAIGTQFVLPDEDGPGVVVDGPRPSDAEEPDRDLSYLDGCRPGASGEDGDEGDGDEQEEDESEDDSEDMEDMEDDDQQDEHEGDEHDEEELDDDDHDHEDEDE